MLRLGDDRALAAATEAVENGLADMGLPTKIAIAYPVLYPLVKEHRAMQEAIWRTGDPNLAAAWPDVATPEEAVMLARYEYRMPLEEAERLAAMLPFPGQTLSEEGATAETLWPSPPQSHL